MRNFLPYILLVILALIWGSSFILMKEGLKAMTPIQMAAFRIFISGLVFWPLVYKHLKLFDRKDLPWAIAAGFIGSGIPAFLFAIAQTHVSSSIAGALNALTPLFTLIVAYFFTSYVFNGSKILGVLIGLVGALLLIFLKGNGQFDAEFKYALLIVGATTLYGININLIKVKLSKYKAIQISTIPLFSISVICLFVFLFNGGTDFVTDLSGQKLRSIVSVTILGFLGTSVGLLLFNRLIQLKSAIFSSSVTYLIPVVATFLGWIDNEQISIYQLIGLVLILFGIYLINRRKTKLN